VELPQLLFIEGVIDDVSSLDEGLSYDYVRDVV